ncbi:MAG: DNA damage-inducible protein D [Candidatus Falkowbacteria bacterium]
MAQVIFESIKHVNEFGSDYWTARELANALEYVDYRNFIKVVSKAKEACKNSGQDIHNHFVDINDMVEVGSGAKREVEDVLLSRYACYLIIQNSDPAKEIVALGQAYFAIQTRRQEMSDQLAEDQMRLKLRDEVKKHNVSLAEAADNAGVKSFAVFQNFGYMGLYGGLKAQDIHDRKKLKKSQKILDHMGSEELAANLFRATQADAKLRRENIHGEYLANITHHEVGKRVRKTIADLGGTMPEDLPIPDAITKAKKRIENSESKKKIDS